ncbi:hypothetical protein QJ856_gp0446 [Tupanvirus deep ocean]|uniref:Uncharacterized protein n=2 Tax=Tupanvirus TaxID=2094720 RepID=A0AC62A9K1_9VIRU|nr:hypothetical protein QJ856_gp0446 [Tupanvirus deep ocean]QKU34298.1 hypothetical protein [Tupanvirus deep ocean]
MDTNSNTTKTESSDKFTQYKKQLETALNKKMDVKTYIDQFNVIGIDEFINCDNISQILYAAILNRFMINMSEEEYVYFKEYQERVFDLVENLRELTTATIPIVLNYLDKINPYLADIIIMLWCMPRTDNFLSKRMYNNKYKENIKKYNMKMIKNIENIVIRNFCIETLTKTNYVPIHCIDYIWFYMNTLSLEFTFYNTESSAYIGFIMPEQTDKNGDTYIDFGFNMEYLLDLGLGQVIYVNDLSKKGSFRNFLKNFVTNKILVEKLLTSNTKNTYRQQLINISKNPSKYFGDTLTLIPEEILDLVNKK